MPGSLKHSPHRVIQQLVVDLELAVDPEDWMADHDADAIPNAVWPVYYAREPDRPDDLVRVRGTEGVSSGWTQVDGERQERHGIQIMVRGRDDDLTEHRARHIAIALDRVHRQFVTVLDPNTGTGSDATVYIVHSFDRTSGVIPLGLDTPEGKRSLFTINGVTAIRQCA